MFLLLPYLVSRPPDIDWRYRKLKLSSLLIKSSRGGNALCIFGLANCATCPAVYFLVRIPSVRRFPPCRCCHVVDHRGHCYLSFFVFPLRRFIYHISGGRVPFFLCPIFPESTAPLAATRSPLCPCLSVTGLPLFLFSAPGPMTMSWGGSVNYTYCCGVSSLK